MFLILFIILFNTISSTTSEISFNNTITNCPKWYKEERVLNTTNCFPLHYPDGSYPEATWKEFRDNQVWMVTSYFEEVNEDNDQSFWSQEFKDNDLVISVYDPLAVIAVKEIALTTCFCTESYTKQIKSKYRLFTALQAIKNTGKILQLPYGIVAWDILTGPGEESDTDLQIYHSAFSANLVVTANTEVIVSHLWKHQKLINSLASELGKSRAKIQQLRDSHKKIEERVTELLEACEENTSSSPDDTNDSGEESSGDKSNFSEETLAKLVEEVEKLKKTQCNHCSVVNRTVQWYGIVAVIAQTILSLVTLVVVIVAKRKPAPPYHPPSRETQLLVLDKPIGRRDRRNKQREVRV